MDSIWDKNKIRLARIEADMEVSVSAESLDITLEYLYMLENGKKRPSETLIQKMANLYKVSVSFFLKSENFLAEV